MNIMITNCFVPVSDIHPLCSAHNRCLLVGPTLLPMLFSGTSGDHYTEDGEDVDNDCQLYNWTEIGQPESGSSVLPLLGHTHWPRHHSVVQVASMLLVLMLMKMMMMTMPMSFVNFLPWTECSPSSSTPSVRRLTQTHPPS